MGFYQLFYSQRSEIQLGCLFLSDLSPLISLFIYQLAFFTPGMRPWSASSRKQIRQIPNLR